MSYCSTAGPQSAVSQAWMLMWQCSAAERSGVYAFSLFPGPNFSHPLFSSYPFLHWLWLLLKHFLCQFRILSQHKTDYFAETDYLKGMNFYFQRWALGSTCCGHEAVVSVTALLDLRLTVEAVKLFAELPKDLLAKGKQMMVFWVTETMASRPPCWSNSSPQKKEIQTMPLRKGKIH